MFKTFEKAQPQLTINNRLKGRKMTVTGRSDCNLTYDGYRVRDIKSPKRRTISVKKDRYQAPGK